ncbi:MAG: hypothetical protein J6B96_05375 [Agathobacter sp.]|nr:hypothetical protein [Agathobacter sp.]
MMGIALALVFGGLFIFSCSICLGIPFCILVGHSRKVKGTTFVILAWVSAVVALTNDIRGIQMSGAGMEDLPFLIIAQFLLPYALIGTIYSVLDADGQELDNQRRFNIISVGILIIYAIIRLLIKLL